MDNTIAVESGRLRARRAGSGVDGGRGHHLVELSLAGVRLGVAGRKVGRRLSHRLRDC